MDVPCLPNCGMAGNYLQVIRSMKQMYIITSAIFGVPSSLILSDSAIGDSAISSSFPILRYLPPLSLFHQTPLITLPLPVWTPLIILVSDVIPSKIYPPNRTKHHQSIQQDPCKRRLSRGRQSREYPGQTRPVCRCH